MTTQIGHLQYNIQPENVGFYRDLMGHLGWETLYDDHGMLGCGSGTGQSVWFSPTSSTETANSDALGLNHLAFAAASVEDVDQLAAWLTEHGTTALYETPRHRPDFSGSDDDTYYQVMFTSPDGILFEMVYIGPK